MWEYENGSRFRFGFTTSDFMICGLLLLIVISASNFEIPASDSIFESVTMYRLYLIFVIWFFQYPTSISPVQSIVLFSLLLCMASSIIRMIL